MEFDIDEIKAAAKECAPGPWHLHTSPAQQYTETLTGCSHYEEEYWAVVSDVLSQAPDRGYYEKGVLADNGQYYPQRVMKEDARWMVATNPKAILALVADYERIYHSLRKIRSGLTMTVEYDLSPAMVEGAIRNKMIELGWTPPKSAK